MTLRLPLSVKDNASGQFDSGVSASSIVFPLKSGEGDLFPVTYNGAATSAGDKNTLNSTGVGSLGIQVGDGIYNITDGSSAIVAAVNADSLITTDLRGGSGNTWDDTDAFTVNPFVITASKKTSGVVTTFEKILIDYRSGDNLNCRLANRGYSGTTPQSFLADDFIEIFVEQEVITEINDAISQLFLEKLDSDILTTKGDMFVRTADGIVRLPAGNDDEVLTADSSEALGVKWTLAGGGADFGEIKQFAMSLSGAVTEATLLAAGWALCDGTTPVSQGITSPTIATTPDLSARFIRGAATAVSGATGGADSVTISLAQMPSHGHSMRFPSDSSSAVKDMTSDIGTGGASAARGYINTAGSGGASKLKTYSEGSGSAHENKPPYYELAFFIKVK